MVNESYSNMRRVKYSYEVEEEKVDKNVKSKVKMKKGSYAEFISFIKKIQNSENEQSKRVICADRMVHNKSFMDYYVDYLGEYAKFIDSGAFNKNSPLSEDNNVFKLIEFVANSILFTSDVKEENRKSKLMKTRQKIDIKVNREEKFDSFNFTGENGNSLSTQDIQDYLQYKSSDIPKNKYLPKTQEIFNDDYFDEDYNSLVTVYNGTGYEVKSHYITNTMNDYELLREDLKESIKNQLNNIPLKTKLSKHRAFIKQDMIDLKNGIKKPIYFKRLRHGGDCY